MQWFARIFCFLGMHTYVPSRYVWVQYKGPMYFDDPNYSKEGEGIVSAMRCTCCNKRIDIEVLK
jgi:hypothetical protein